MALIDKKLMVGFALGFGAGLLAPRVIPAAAEAARPLLKAAVRTGVMLLDQTREAAAHLREAMEDGVAEARARHSRPVEPTEVERAERAA